MTDTWPGRGGHQMLVVHETDGNPYLWVIGGRGGDNSMNGGPEVSKGACPLLFFILQVSVLFHLAVFPIV